MRRAPADGGFTLIELMVVVLIIAILLAIAIPAYLGARTRANDRATQQSVHNTYKTEEVIYADNAGYTDDLTRLTAAEPGTSYTDSVSAMVPNGKVIFVGLEVPDNLETVVIGGRSASGTCWWVRAIGSQQQPRFARNDCSATPAIADFTDSWSS